MNNLNLVTVFTVLCCAASFGHNQSARNFNSDCGQVFTQKQFVIESPGYPSNYPPDFECSYLVKGPTCPTRFSLQFVDFSIEESLGCYKDRLEIGDKDAVCGSRYDTKEYFSDKGTLILKFVSDKDITGRGYRIFVSRSSCQSEQPTIPSVPKWHTTNSDVEYTTTKRPTYNQGNKCCQTSYNSKQFTLASPNFPYSMSKPTECLFEIYKTNSNICRLRIHVQFFWLGRPSNNCPEGFLEIDGKFICGCQRDLKLIVPFGNEHTKILRFVSRGYERSSYSGFVMNFVQDECPKKYIPEDVKTNLTQEKFRFYNDQIKRVAWPNKSHDSVIEKLHLISENTEVIDDKPQVVRHVYFYAPPDFNRIPRDREETDYIDTSIVSTSFVQNSYSYNYCLNWNRLQFNALPLRNFPICKTDEVSEGNVEPRKCLELNHLRGYFKSPGYPFYYPGNMHICYRFVKEPGYCSIKIHMRDFNLQNSNACENDYLLFANQLRYCGSRLSNTISTLDLRDKPYEEITFVTDEFYCGRGFFGSYEQIPCQEKPITPAPIPCSRTIQDEMFTLDVYDYHESPCSFLIKKSKQYVCSVTLYFERFDLVCASESLVIDGTMYCGHLSGQSVKISVTDQDPVIIYKRISPAGVDGLRLRIKGVQTSEDCPYPEVPAERIFHIPSPRKIQLENNSKFLLKIDKHFKDICGVVTNTTEINLPETFCDFIMQNQKNITNCLPIKANSLFVPIDSHKIELKIQDVEKTEEIEFQEVDCDEVGHMVE
ncbi:cubilin [Tribolium castaneum]|uniref:Cubilin-like Protein n=1 Tax=Tribolium castaneum TaxID=7070 RepID=D6WKF5_TRICA|nr:PREDICTED: cubilin [Tribolium castaneum]EFA03587.2 Cubilin-like Protein [Tribolium castaneum]|eukprot:XP_008193300.1 PREDICTED: cubilin [Tribolium castaneum]